MTASRRFPLTAIVIAVTLILFTGIGVLAVWQIQRANQPITWLADQPMIGVCEAAESLTILHAQRADAAAADPAAARTALASLIPGIEAAELSRPLAVRIDLPGIGQTTALMVVARLSESAAVVLYLSPSDGSLLYAVNALNAQPENACR